MGTWIEISSPSSPFNVSLVVPYVGTWIEIHADTPIKEKTVKVVPYVGTWIEIYEVIEMWRKRPVVPYVGTWIEIYLPYHHSFLSHRRSLRGNVDRNLGSLCKMSKNMCRSLRGNVDRNMLIQGNAVPGEMSFPTWERG